MKIVHVTAGAGGRLCGSCLHDNALVKSLQARGCDAVLLPAYVPITTDEESVAVDRVVMGGVNVWLEQEVPLYRNLPWPLDRVVGNILDSRWLLGWLSGRTGSTRAVDLGPLTASTLAGELGHQRKEVEKLARWLAAEMRPDSVHLSNVLLVGLARMVKQATGAKVVCSLSGEDVFVDQLPQDHRARVMDLLRERAADVDHFVALNERFARFSAESLGIPVHRISVVHHGVDPAGFPPEAPDLVARRRSRNGRLVVGMLARACPEKGLEQLVRAIPSLLRPRDVEVLAAGAEVPAERRYLEHCLSVAAELGVADRFRWLGQVDRPEKIRLLGAIDVFTMPTVHPEAKGLPVIEAMAAGVPVVASRHGSFPELLDAEQAGLLHAPSDPVDLARAIGRLLDDPDHAARCGRHGHARARSRHAPERMAAGHMAIYERLLQGTGPSTTPAGG
ncbi:MAG: glycosyltransferase family 4 protein [Planctomycetia bacterium]